MYDTTGPHPGTIKIQVGSSSWHMEPACCCCYKRPVSAQCAPPTAEPIHTNYLKIDAWESELDDSFPYYDEVMTGIRDGFPLVNREVDSAPVERENYHSATNPKVRDKVEAQIKVEVAEGRYQIVDYKPHIVSSIGAIEKSNDKVRIIHDASQPSQGSLNSFAVLDEKTSFESVQNAAAVLKKGYYMAKLDFKSAYRSVRIAKSHHTLAGLKWHFSDQEEPVYMVDTRLPFGSRLAPLHFHKISQAVKHIMQKRGSCDLVAYLDDFLLIAPTYQECMENLNNVLDNKSII